MVDQTVVSVGPYMFHTSSARARRSSAKERGRASPPQSTRRSLLPSQPDTTSSFQVAGVACIKVTPSASIRRARTPPSRASSSPTMATRAPTVSGRNSSSTAMSNEIVVTAKMTSSSVMPGSSAMESRKFATAPCGTSTPFGFPVEPDV